MAAPRNILKENLANGKMQVGLWMGFGSATVAELASSAGFDWCLIDAEHNPNSDKSAMSQLQAMNGAPAQAVMRVTSGQDWLLKRALDIGVQSLLVPLIDTAEEAAEMARAVRYPPEGNRGMGAIQARATGYGADSDYVASANDQICLMVQAESRKAIENIDAIAATEGVDVVFIGPADLSADMGYPGQPDAPEVVTAIEYAVSRILAAGKAVGTITFNPDQIGYYKALGVTFLGVGGDVATFASSVRALARHAQEQIE